MAEIKISDLSIGDWVMMEGKKFQIYQLALAGDVYGYRRTNDSDTGEEYYDGEIGDVEPIPLTPEILEKNGFVDYGNEYYMYDDGKKHRVYISNRNKYWNFEHCEFGLGCVFHDMKCEILHTHQLQHALRLAGVEKEIEV